MIKCMRATSSSTAKCFTTSNRFYASEIPIRFTPTGSSASKLGHDNNIHEHELSTFTSELAELVDIPPSSQHADADPKKRRDLPVSPLINPYVFKARTKVHATKATLGDIGTEFHNQLSKNAYALALATPVRRCQMTKIALPRFFLQSFGMMSHPNTGDPYFVPRGLLAKFSNAKENILNDEPSDPRKVISRRIGQSSYILARQPMLYAVSINNRKGPFGVNPTKHLAPARVKYQLQAMEVHSRAEWRPDMHDFVLELMRRRVVESLGNLFRLNKGYLSSFDDWEIASSIPQTGAYLWIGKNGNPNQPPEFATLLKERQDKVSTRKIPVHNLRLLLGEEKLEKLLDLCPSNTKTEENLESSDLKTPDPNPWDALGRGFLGTRIITVRNRKMTVDLQLRLWWLQGYLAKHEAFSSRMNTVLKSILIEKNTPHSREQAEGEGEEEDKW